MFVLNENSVRNVLWMYNIGCFVLVWRGLDLLLFGVSFCFLVGD